MCFRNTYDKILRILQYTHLKIFSNILCRGKLQLSFHIAIAIERRFN